MRIDFNQIQEMTMPCLHGGPGEMSARLFGGEGGKLISCRIHPGGGIGLHSPPTSDDVNFVLLGTGLSATAKRSPWSPACATSAKGARSTASRTPAKAIWCCSPWWWSGKTEGRRTHDLCTV